MKSIGSQALGAHLARLRIGQRVNVAVDGVSYPVDVVLWVPQNPSAAELAEVCVELDRAIPGATLRRF